MDATNLLLLEEWHHSPNFYLQTSNVNMHPMLTDGPENVYRPSKLENLSLTSRKITSVGLAATKHQWGGSSRI